MTPTLVAALAILAMVGPVATDMYLPGLPAMRDDLLTTPGAVQLTLSLFMLGMATGQLFWGPLSDALGRRGPLVVAASLFVVASGVAAVADSIELLIVMRFVQGFLGTAGIVIGRAVARDLSSGAELAKLFSVIGIVMGIAPIAAPIVGGLLIDSIGWRGVLWVVTAIAAIMAAVAIVLIPESLTSERRVAGSARQFFGTLGGIVRDVPYLGYVGVSIFTFGVVFAYISGSSVVLQEVYGLTSQQFTLVFAINMVGMMGVGILNTRLVGRLGPSRLLTLGLGVLTIGGIALGAIGLLGMVPPLWLLVALVFVTTTTMPMINANASALGLGRHGKGAGMAAALMGSLQYGVAGLVSPMVTITGEASVSSMAIVMLVCALLASASSLLYRRAKPVVDA
mgnify:FL=1